MCILLSVVSYPTLKQHLIILSQLRFILNVKSAVISYKNIIYTNDPHNIVLVFILLNSVTNFD